MSEATDIFPGGAYEGQDDSVAVVGQISVSSLSLTFEAEGLLLDMPTQGLRMDWNGAGDRILFSHEKYPGWNLYSLDDAILEHRAFHHPWLKRRLAELRPPEAEENHARRVYKVIATLAAIVVVLWVATDPIIGLIVKNLPPAWEQKVGKEAFSEITSIFPLTDEAPLTNRVHLVSQRLKKGLPHDAPKFKFFVSTFPIPNAVALPGGDVIVFNGLLGETTPEELAAVLAHEMAHVIEKHGMRQLAQQVGGEFLGKYIFGGDGALAALTAGASEFGSLQYSRDHERAADELAFEILLRANIDPRGLAGFFKKLDKYEGKRESSILSTHPATSERINYLETLWMQSPKKSGFERVNAGPALPE